MKKIIFKNLEEFKSFKGKKLPVGNWYTITQEMITNFANATLDQQWIHIDEKKAEKESPFKSTIAHGFMSVSMITKRLEELFEIQSVTMGLNYGVNKVRFPAPVLVDSKLRLHATVSEIETLALGGIKVTFETSLELKNQQKPACVAEFLVALFE